MAELLQLGNIKPAGADNIVVDGKYVKGGYVVVASIAERDALKEAKGENIVTGSLCYCSGTKRFYQFDENAGTSGTGAWVPAPVEIDHKVKLQYDPTLRALTFIFNAD